MSATSSTRAADHRHDLRLVREPHRAQAQQARRRHGDRQLRDREATVEFDPAAVAPEQLVEAVEAAGYEATLPARRRRRRGAEEPEGDPPLRRRLLVCALLSLPLLLISMIPALQFDNWQWLALNLATPVVLWGAWPFHRAAWANLRHGTATMDTLVSVGVARRVALVALRAVPRRRRHDRHADAAAARPGARAPPTRSTSRRPRSSRRSSSPGAGSRRARSAARAAR